MLSSLVIGVLKPLTRRTECRQFCQTAATQFARFVSTISSTIHPIGVVLSAIKKSSTSRGLSYSKLILSC